MKKLIVKMKYYEWTDPSGHKLGCGVGGSFKSQILYCSDCDDYYEFTKAEIDAL